MRRILPLALLMVAAAFLVTAPATGQGKDDDTKTHHGVFLKAKGNVFVMSHEGKEHAHILARNAKVICDGKACKITDLKRGTYIEVTTPADNLKLALRVEADTKKKVREREKE